MRWTLSAWLMFAVAIVIALMERAGWIVPPDWLVWPALALALTVTLRLARRSRG